MLNLQFFAEEELNEEKNVDKTVDEKIKKEAENEEEIETEEELENEENEEEIDISDLEDEKEKVKDKKESAIIKYKREKKEAQKRIEELEKILLEQKNESDIKEKSKKLIEEGFDEKNATKLAALEIENLRLKKSMTDRSFKDLEIDYPGIGKHQKEIVEMMGKYEGMQPQEIFLAKFADSDVYDNKTKLEQQLLHQQKVGKEKAGAGAGGVETEARTKITATEKRQYLEAKKLNKDLTVKRFLELNNDSSEIIEE